MAVKARVGRIATVAIIDTGSERTLGNLALRDALNQHQRAGAGSHLLTVFGATSELAQGDAQVLPTISIDSLRIREVTAVYGDFHIFEVWGLASEPALIIGMDIFGTVGAMSIDFKHQLVYLLGDRMLPERPGLQSYGLARPGK